MTETEKDKLVTALDKLVRSVVPKASTVAKYGGTLYTLRPNEKEGQFCGVFPYKNHVQLSFARGSELDDPSGVLEGSGKARRHINFTDSDELDVLTIKKLIRSAKST